jgi:hypothetical protein
MRKVVMLLILAAAVVFAGGAVDVLESSPPVAAVPFHPDLIPPQSGEGAGYYYWDSTETGEWAPSYSWRTPRNPRGWRGDDTYWSLPIPFDIRFCNVNHPEGSNLYVGSNGILGFDMAGMDEPINHTIPSPGVPNAVLAPLWDNLHGYSNGDICVEEIGAAPNQKWCISYSPWYFYNAPVNPIEFQVYFYEAPMSGVNNTIEFRYKDMIGDSWRDHGLSATVGLEDASGLEGIQYSYEEEAIPNQFAIRFVDSRYVDDQLGEFHLLTPEDDYYGETGEVIHFTWEESDYSGHGAVNYTLYLADNDDFDDALVFDRGGQTWMDYIFGSGETGSYWWKVRAVESDLGITQWSEEVFVFHIFGPAVEETTWGRIKADF